MVAIRYKIIIPEIDLAVHEPINKGKRIFDNSFLNCYGRINLRRKMPKETIVSSTFSSDPQMQYKYFIFF